MIKKIIFISLFLLTSFTVAFAIAEIAVRKFKPQEEARKGREEHALPFVYDETLGWRPEENASKRVNETRWFSVKHNSLGFRDHEYGSKTKPRILFVGDSFVYGANVEQEERFTEKLQAMIPGAEILNLGVSGYGTDQEFLLLQRHFDRLKPDVVFLVFDYWNDFEDNSTNDRGGYTKPYYVIDGGQPKLEGVPVPKPPKYFAHQYPWLFKSRFVEASFVFLFYKMFFHTVVVPDPTFEIIRSMKSFVESKGARFALGLTGGVDDFADELINRDLAVKLNGGDIPYVSLETRKIYVGDWHWTPEGHDWVAHQIYDSLQPVMAKGSLKSDIPCRDVLVGCLKTGKRLDEDCLFPLAAGKPVAGFGPGLSAVRKCLGPTACDRVVNACRLHGYFVGGAAKHKGIASDCVGPALKGARVADLEFNAADLEVCRNSKANISYERLFHPEPGLQKVVH